MWTRQACPPPPLARWGARALGRRPFGGTGPAAHLRAQSSRRRRRRTLGQSPDALRPMRNGRGRRRRRTSPRAGCGHTVWCPSAPTAAYPGARPRIRTTVWCSRSVGAGGEPKGLRPLSRGHGGRRRRRRPAGPGGGGGAAVRPGRRQARAVPGGARVWLAAAGGRAQVLNGPEQPDLSAGRAARELRDAMQAEGQTGPVSAHD